MPVVVPGSTPGPSSCNDLAWSTAYPEITALIGGYYGDTSAADRHWESLVRYMANVVHNAANSSHGVAVCDQFLDWVTAVRAGGFVCWPVLSHQCINSGVARVMGLCVAG